MKKITKWEVLLYMAEKILSRQRRCELEAASESDPEVKRWFEELTPTDAELDQEPIPPAIGPDTTEDSIPPTVEKYFIERAKARHKRKEK